MKPIFSISCTKFGKTYNLKATLSDHEEIRIEQMTTLKEELEKVLISDELSEGFEPSPVSFPESINAVQ